MKGSLAFAKQKLGEIATLARGLNQGRQAVADALAESRDRPSAAAGRRGSIGPRSKQRLAAVDAEMLRRSAAFAQRRTHQQAALRLPLLPTTTIGSFPQTAEVRQARAA